MDDLEKEEEVPFVRAAVTEVSENRRDAVIVFVLLMMDFRVFIDAHLCAHT